MPRSAATRVVDPRPPAGPRSGRPARRPESLSEGRVLLWDNGKLDPGFGKYRAVFDVLRGRLTAAFADLVIEERTQDLLVGGLDRLDGLVAELAAHRPAGVIFALCDTGVSQPTVILAARLEAAGIPTSLVCQGIGLRVAAATAAAILPGLPMAGITAIRTATYEMIAAEAEAIAPAVIAGLTDSEPRLMERFAGLRVAEPVAGAASGFLEVDGDDPTLAFTETMAACGLGDGFPLVVPTPKRVEALLTAAGLAPDDQVWPAVPPRAVPITARQVAAVAVMAGCRPEWMPVVLAAYRAMAVPEFRLFQAAITTHPSGTLVLVSGPAAARFGLASGPGCLGPGFPANAAIGRAVALSYSFLLGARPGGSDLTLQGSPAEYAYCVAENLAESPWPGLHVELAGPDVTTVTVLKCEGPHNVLDNFSTTPQSLLGSVASTAATLGGNNAYNPAQTVVFLNPEHARIIADAGWTRRDVQDFLFDAARHDRERLRGRGIAPIWPAWFHAALRVPVARCAEDFLVVVAGGGGPQSQVAIPWGYSRGITVPLPADRER